MINIYDTNYESESKIDFVNISDMSNVSDDDALAVTFLIVIFLHCCRT